VTDAQRPPIVILEAGVAGVHAARELTRLLPTDEDGDITLVNQDNDLLLTPLLIEVVGGQVETRHRSSAARVGLDWTLDAVVGTEIAELPIARSPATGDEAYGG